MGQQPTTNTTRKAKSEKQHQTMALFAALTTKDGNAVASSTSLLPEAIQLHSHLRIDFLNGATVAALLSSASSNSAIITTPTTTTATPTSANVNGLGIDSSRNAFSLLSYQAVQTQRQDDEYPPAATNNGSNALLAFERHKQRHQDVSRRPDLGIWNCRIVHEDENDKYPTSIPSTSLAAMLLRRVVLNNDRFKASGGGGSSNSNGGREEKKVVEEADGTEGQPHHGSDSSIHQQKQIIHSPPMVMVVDMSELSEIQQQVERMKGVIVNAYENKNNTDGGEDVLDDECSSKSHTTSIRALKNSVFGAAAMINDSSSSSPPAPSALPSSGGNRIALILAVIVPPSRTNASSTNATEEYKERRARDLVLYHLHKFSMEVDCTLCFVRREGEVEGEGLPDVQGGSGRSEGGDGGSVDDTTMVNYLPTMSIDEFSKVIRRVALGLSPVEVETIPGMAAEEDDLNEDGPSHNPRQTTPSIYAPGTHDDELINGVYLRNASCDGSWDAVTDDLNVALPPRSGRNQRSASASGEEGTKDLRNGDQEWLSELANSMGISSDALSTAEAPATTPKAEQLEKESKPKKRVTRASTSSSTRDKDAKPKDQKEVLDFFANLKKK
jgi:hypothetical protein